MIYFVTDRPHQFNDSRITVTKDFGIIHNYLNSVNSFAFDTEFNNLNAFLATPLLAQIGNKENQYVIDCISFPSFSWLNPYRSKHIVGHNLKIDLAIASLNGFELKPNEMKIWDTMICEQRLGLDSHRLNNLEATAARRINVELNK